ncbi:hypothetical protein CFC21_044260 [Triticum aestivum]|uniref:Amino acid transporter transmembrane domain-containing protein n=2 Tax=Triticum aestivum TaxID=4565 RepID=A0A9R1FRM7_WHEAT|nr:hypothetical protein CFC21_044260 [Triticum aestivum]CDM86373.1 unnamed protein product [Triticum aestivum]
MAAPPRSVAVAISVAEADRARLHQLGYKRGLSVVSNFAFSFSLISVLTGVTSTYNTGQRYGGPASMTLGWLVVAWRRSTAASPCPWRRSARRTRPPAASTTGAPSSPAGSGRPSPPGSPAGSTSSDRASVEFIFTHFNKGLSKKHFNKDNAWQYGMGVHGKAYILATEETKNADRSGPIGIITSVSLATVIGWVYLVVLTSIMTDTPYLLSADNDAGGYAIAQALYNTFYQRYGSTVGGLACLGDFAVAMFLCGKDGSLGSQVAFQTMLSIAALGLYISYALPIFFRVTTARRSFIPGPFHLGRYRVIICWAAVLWVAFVTVLFSLPVAYPVAKEDFNYTLVAVGGVLLRTVGSWVFHARFWFKGPIINVDTY